MKKVFILAGVAASAIFLAGCAGVTTNNGMPVPLFGFAYTEMSAGSFIQDKVNKDFDVIQRDVFASATATSYFTFIATGDVSYETLKKQALQNIPGANDLIDITVDYKMENVIGINKITVTLRGTAVKYKK